MYETFITKISQYHFHRVCYSSVTCQLPSVTRCSNGFMTKCFFKKHKTAGDMHRRYDLCFLAARTNLLYS